MSYSGHNHIADCDTELQERFDCIVEADIDEKDVYKMIEVSPQILNQKRDVIEEKIDFIVNNLGLLNFPSFLYSSEGVLNV